MKKLLALVIILLAANIFLARTYYRKNPFTDPVDTAKTIMPAKYLSNEDELINTILMRYHYSKFKLDDSLSGVIYDRYLKSLDYSKNYFLASDIADFDMYKYQFGEDIKDGNLFPAYQMFNVFRQRVNERLDYAEALLQKGFDFNKNESLTLDRDNAPWAKDTTELNELWRKKVKNDALNKILTGEKWTGVQQDLKKRYENLRRAVMQSTSEDVFQLFENSYTEAIDPHTNYFSPVASENFKIDMSRTLSGIGAQLQTEDDYTKIAEIIPGGPAFKSKQLHPNDRIVGVAQGKDGEMVDVIGWRITDVVQLIRGPKGSVVRLQILPASEGVNGKPTEITLVRDEIKLEEQSAKDKILDIKDDNKDFKLGVITVPAFYSDFEAEQRGEKNYKSTTRDVQKLLDELKKEKVQGIIIDLRNNGGGSLEEAIKLTGLFIKNGPVVQIKNADGTVHVEDDPDTAIDYSGPLVVLVNRFSASASEIFSAAIQDYGRGLIIGEQTYGKGTVQNLIDLNRLMPNDQNKLGQIKLTIAKFYRVTGASTQHLGVVPDIQYPTAFDSNEYMESSEPSSLPWDQISPTAYQPYGNLKPFINKLIEMHDARIKNDPEFDEYLSEIKEFKDAHEKKTISLNEAVRKKEQDEADAKNFEKENERRKKLGLKLLQKGELPSDSDKTKDDPLLDETGHILADFISIS